MPAHAFTIRKLADAAGVGVEAVRYYQRRGLMGQPQRKGGGFRTYAQSDVQRLQFIKRAQELGFSLDDVSELISLDAESDQLRVREVAQRRVTEIQEHVAHLNLMANALQDLVGCCKRSAPAAACPIIDALVAKPATVAVAADSDGKITARSMPRDRAPAARRVEAAEA
jgi:Hg(II)-responsive transcriptional regulator